MLVLTVRLIFSLAVVVGLLLLITRLSARRMRGPADSLVKLVERRALSRTSAVSLITVGSRILVIGTTEHEMRLLTELDSDEIEIEAPVTKHVTTALASTALDGSMLSPLTWKQAFAAATGRVRDRA